MELLYIYINDDQKNIKDCEFNFSPNFTFMLNRQTKTFSMVYEEKLPNEWFGSNIRNISAIIGKNGAGKSNLMECIIHALCYQDGGIIIYMYRGQLWVNLPSFYNDYRFNFKVSRMNRWSGPLIQHAQERVKDASVVYYSPTIDRNMNRRKKDFGNFIDLSNSTLLRYKKHETYKVPDYAVSPDVDVMLAIDTFKILLFFVYMDKFEYKIPIDIRIPEYAVIQLHVFNDNAPIHPTFKVLTADKDNSFPSQLKYFILKQVFEEGFESSAWDENTTMDDVLFTLNNNESFRPNLYKLLVEAYDNGLIQYKTEARATKKGIDMEFRIKIEGMSEPLLSALYQYYFKQGIPYISFSSFNLLNGIVNDSISIKWDGLSSGELSFLIFFARLFGSLFEKQGETHHATVSKNYIRDEYDDNTVIILLDEAELSMHPEWQQKFIYVLIDSLGKIFPNIFFQIILASHSPILISDLPKSNITFLYKENGRCKVDDSSIHKQTFGANIHTLFNDSFFLEGVPIGNFAKCKISNIFDLVFKEKACSSIILNEIYRIGEPILRSSLLKQFEANAKESSRHERIEMLKHEIKLLQGEKNDKD